MILVKRDLDAKPSHNFLDHPFFELKFNPLSKYFKVYAYKLPVVCDFVLPLNASLSLDLKFVTSLNSGSYCLRALEYALL